MKRNKNILVAQVLQAEFSHTLYHGVCDYALVHQDWKLHLISGEQFLENHAGWEFDGLIISANLDRLENVHCPIVSTHSTKEIPETLPQVDEDQLKSGALAAEHLMALGHEHFACVQTFAGAHQARTRGFVDRLQKNGREVSVVELDFPSSIIDRRAEMEQWLLNLPRPVALFATCDQAASNILRLCLDNHWAVPEEIAILGCEDEQSICRSIRPALSSIQLPYRRIGYEAARMLDQLLQGKKLNPRIRLFPPHRVVVRASTDTLAIPDPHLRRAVQYIRSHADERIDINAMADFSGVSLRSLQYLFKKGLNRTPNEEFNRAKIERIKELLISTDLTLNEIAEKTSFSTEYYMGSVFKRHTKMTPGQYRKEHSLR